MINNIEGGKDSLKNNIMLKTGLIKCKKVLLLLKHVFHPFSSVGAR